MLLTQLFLDALPPAEGDDEVEGAPAVVPGWIGLDRGSRSGRP
jgi:hypothetical protein